MLNQYNKPLADKKLILFVEILFRYNCRYHELITASRSNFYPNRFLILQGAKQSSNVIIRDLDILDKVARLINNDNELIFAGLKYHTVNRFIRANYQHLINSIVYRNNRKITHLARYLNVANIKDDTYIRDVLHHRSVRSNKFYTNKHKGK